MDLRIEMMAVVCERSPVQILCLGIGSASVPAARDQWALLQDMRQHIYKHCGTQPVVVVFDPQFEDMDVALVQRQRAQLPLENKCGAYQLSEPTLVYMPHCPKELYEALLRANWRKEALERVILCGNELSLYSTDMSAFPCLERIAPYTHAYPVPSLPTSTAGALDACIQVFFSPWQDMPDSKPAQTWTYQPVRRKARARRARSSLVREPMRMEEDAFWSLPQARLEHGPEVLTTPVMNTTRTE